MYRKVPQNIGIYTRKIIKGRFIVGRSVGRASAAMRQTRVGRNVADYEPTFIRVLTFKLTRLTVFGAYLPYLVTAENQLR